MDPWSYLEGPVPEENHSKPRLHPGDDLAALTMLYEQCKVENPQSDTQNKVHQMELINSQFQCFILKIFYHPEPERAEDHSLQPEQQQHVQTIREVKESARVMWCDFDRTQTYEC